MKAFDTVINQVRNRLGMTDESLMVLGCSKISTDHMSKKVRLDKGTTGQRDEGKTGQVNLLL